MNFSRNILGRLLAAWALIVFIVPMLILWIPFWLIGSMPEPRRTRVFIDISRGWMNIFFFLTGVRRVYKGREHFRKNENYIVVCNHNSFMDVPITSVGIPGANKTIAKIEMARIPLFGLIYRRGSVLVDRKSEESRKASYVKMKEVLDMGMHMCIYPEGTRNKGSEPLQRFHDGAFKLAIDTGKPVIPALIFNSKKIMPNDKKFFFWPHRLEMHFLEAVCVEEGDSYQDLRDRVYGLMKAYFVGNA